MAYATVTDVRAKLTDTGLTDDSIAAALELADSLIDLRSHGVFRSLTSQTVYDVRADTVVLQHPGDITTVMVEASRCLMVPTR